MRWLKAVILAFLVLSYVLCSLISYPLSLWVSEVSLLKFRAKNTSFWSGLILKVFRVKLLSPEILRALQKEKGLVVSNHLSYVDILLISSCLPSIFVTSREIEETPLVGLVCKAAGTIFVERRNRTTLTADIESMSALLKKGVRVAFFPEGTTTDGSKILPFRKSLIESATSSQSDVIPLCIQYQTINGRPITSETQKKVFYFGNATFFKHLYGLLSVKTIEVSISAGEILRGNDVNCRKEAALKAREQILQIYQPIQI